MGIKFGSFFTMKPPRKVPSGDELVTFLGMEDIGEEGGVLEQHIMPFSKVKQGLTYFERGDVLVAKITPCFENGKGAHVDLLATMVGFGSTEFHVLRAKNIADPKYIFYHTQTQKFRKQLELEMTGTAGQKRVPAQSIIKYEIEAVHTKDEQRAIAAALSDVDALLASLDALIAKKRAIKQGAMQELLTGKRRLPGFSGEWKNTKLGEMGVFRGGNGFPVIYQGKVDGDYPFFKVSDMNNEGNQIFMINSNNWISDIDRKSLRAFLFPKFSIVFAKIGAAIFLERKKILAQDSCFDNNMMGFILNADVAYYRYIHYLFLSISLGKLVSTTALPSINGKDVSGLEYAIPSLDEQKAISSVLSDIDAEIQTLEQQCDKIRQIKQGMMQELLTGRTRLI